MRYCLAGMPNKLCSPNEVARFRPSPETTHSATNIRFAYEQINCIACVCRVSIEMSATGEYVKRTKSESHCVLASQLAHLC